ncbi:MAG: hypothetical protein I3270_02265 [Candidatus Moeniiplasma glomeromycotorum]|nr:hypothetical protein [Candidatus Moeniiplasma glomeromycotorum]MCE8162521.1 hypothetical protein [Candidatus Moeniiplasma glomeromycotorum]MCE8166448.1 hypothetical protein [Candidatus Moeniiplasma glomeromycotorum]MCE8166933.1 hypothetical protein [Candidatus Moeniiplasma glomeromycotorum]
MEKEIRKSNVYLTCPAKPGPTLTFLGKSNMPKFIREFNEKVKNENGKYVKVEIKLFRNGTYEFKIKDSPLVHKIFNRPDNYAQLKKDEKREIRKKDRKEISQEELQELVHQMLPFLNTTDLIKAQKMVVGTVNSLGVKIKE